MADENLFDGLARAAGGGSRRDLFRIAAAALIGGALTTRERGSASAARGRLNGQSCRENSDCASEYCALTDPKHNRGVCAFFCPSESISPAGC
jgi:hypothetical protein